MQMRQTGADHGGIKQKIDRMDYLYQRIETIFRTNPSNIRAGNKAVATGIHYPWLRIMDKVRFDQIDCQPGALISGGSATLRNR